MPLADFQPGKTGDCTLCAPWIICYKFRPISRVLKFHQSVSGFWSLVSRFWFLVSLFSHTPCLTEVWTLDSPCPLLINFGPSNHFLPFSFDESGWSFVRMSSITMPKLVTVLPGACQIACPNANVFNPGGSTVRGCGSCMSVRAPGANVGTVHFYGITNTKPITSWSGRNNVWN